jgi:L-ascorbate metabolism protein UlaG (beta-lactamase superfamily)
MTADGAKRSRSQLLARALRSGLRRYPKELLASLWPAGREGRAAAWGLARSWARLPAGESTLAVAWLGHCTVLIRIAGRTVLTDPVLAERIGVRIARRTIGLSRLFPAPLKPEQLPPIDLVLLSHAHFDHLDRPTLRALADRRTQVITARRTRRLVPPGFGGVSELGWNERLELDGLVIEALRPRHWGARAAWDVHRGYNAYVLSAAPSGNSRGRSVFFAGDTADTDRFAPLGEREIDLAIFGIGAYAPWEHAHATPEQVWRMFKQIGARRLLAVHHSTFDLGEEAPGEPMFRLRRAAGREAHAAILDAPIASVQPLP